MDHRLVRALSVVILVAAISAFASAENCNPGDKKPHMNNNCMYEECDKDSKWQVKGCPKKYWKSTFFDPGSLECEYILTAWTCTPVRMPPSPKMECRPKDNLTDTTSDCYYWECDGKNRWQYRKCPVKALKNTHFDPDTKTCRYHWAVSGCSSITSSSQPTGACAQDTKVQDETNDCNYWMCDEGVWQIKRCTDEWGKHTHYNHQTGTCEYRFWSVGCSGVKPEPQPTTPPPNNGSSTETPQPQTQTTTQKPATKPDLKTTTHNRAGPSGTPSFIISVICFVFAHFKLSH